MRPDRAPPEILVLEEAAEHLRLPVDTVEEEAMTGRLSGRQVKGTWVFSRSAVDEWRRTYASKAIFLEQAGAFAGDDTLPELLAGIYQRRGRPEV